jgi:hypothetical protein
MDNQLIQSINKQKRIPIEIIHIILVYTRNPQDPILLEDITNFLTTREIIIHKHYNKWITELKYKSGIDIMWLENNLLLYANEEIPTREEIRPKFKEIISRFITKTLSKQNNKNNQNKQQAINKQEPNFNKYVYSNKISVKTRVNILWGLFTVAERNEFIEPFLTLFF